MACLRPPCAAGRRYALTLLPADDIPWHDDGTCDRADERPWFQRRFVEELHASGRPFTEVSGSLNRRLSVATQAIDDLLAKRRARPSPPLPRQ